MPIENLLVMVLCVYLLEDVLNHALLINDECCALNTHIGATVHLLFDPNAESLGHSLFGIAQQREVQLVLCAEVLVRTLAVGANAIDVVTRLGECCLAVTHTFGFECAT